MCRFLRVLSQSDFMHSALNQDILENKIYKIPNYKKYFLPPKLWPTTCYPKPKIKHIPFLSTSPVRFTAPTKATDAYKFL